MLQKLMDYIIKYKLLYEHQFDFQKGKSTEHAILDIHWNLIKVIENHEKSNIIFSDFTEAFDYG